MFTGDSDSCVKSRSTQCSVSDNGSVCGDEAVTRRQRQLICYSKERLEFWDVRGRHSQDSGRENGWWIDILSLRKYLYNISRRTLDTRRTYTHCCLAALLLPQFGGLSSFSRLWSFILQYPYQSSIMSPPAGPPASGPPTKLPWRPFVSICAMYLTNSLSQTILFPFAAVMVASFGVTDDPAKLG